MALHSIVEHWFIFTPFFQHIYGFRAQKNLYDIKLFAILIWQNAF